MALQVVKNDKTYVVNGACVDIEFLVLGYIQNNTYIISDGTSTIVVDPAKYPDRIIDALGGKKLDAIFVTHHHFDHVGALKELHEATGAPVYASAADSTIIENQPAGRPGADSCPVDVKLNDKDKVRIGAMEWKVIATPGHTPGCICFMLNAEDTAHPEAFNVLIAGDTLFCGSIGRTDFEGGDEKQMRASLRRLKQLPNDTLVLPGHNSLTTIGDEQRRVFAYYC